MPSAESTTFCEPLWPVATSAAPTWALVPWSTPFHCAGRYADGGGDERLGPRVRVANLQLRGIRPWRHRVGLPAEAEDVVRRGEADALLRRRLGDGEVHDLHGPEVLAHRRRERWRDRLAQIAGRVEDVRRADVGDEAFAGIELARLLRSVRGVVRRRAVRGREHVVGGIRARSARRRTSRSAGRRP